MKPRPTREGKPPRGCQRPTDANAPGRATSPGRSHMVRAEWRRVKTFRGFFLRAHFGRPPRISSSNHCVFFSLNPSLFEEVHRPRAQSPGMTWWSPAWVGAPAGPAMRSAGLRTRPLLCAPLNKSAVQRAAKPHLAARPASSTILEFFSTFRSRYSQIRPHNRCHRRWPAPRTLAFDRICQAARRAGLWKYRIKGNQEGPAFLAGTWRKPPACSTASGRGSIDGDGGSTYFRFQSENLMHMLGLVPPRKEARL